MMKTRVRAPAAQASKHAKYQSHGGGALKSARLPRGKDRSDQAVSHQLLNEIQSSLKSYPNPRGQVGGGPRQQQVVVENVPAAKTHRVKYDPAKHDGQIEKNEQRRSSPFQVASGRPSSAFSELDDKKFHRFSRCQSPTSEARAFVSPKKERLRKTIHQYQNGHMNSSNFRQELNGLKINVNGKIDTMIRKSEAGNYVNFQSFGREIYKQVEQQDGPSSPLYARNEHPHNSKLNIDPKLNIQIQYSYPNVPQTPQPELNTGCGKPNMFAKFVDQSNKLWEHNEKQELWNEFRHIDNMYQPVRGKHKFAEINDKNKSDIHRVVLRPSELEKKKGHQEYVRAFKTKKIDVFRSSPDSVHITNWDKTENKTLPIKYQKSISPKTNRRNETAGEFKKAYMERVTVCYSSRTGRKNQSSTDFAII